MTYISVESLALGVVPADSVALEEGDLRQVEEDVSLEASWAVPRPTQGRVDTQAHAHAR